MEQRGDHRPHEPHLGSELGQLGAASVCEWIQAGCGCALEAGSLPPSPGLTQLPPSISLGSRCGTAPPGRLCVTAAAGGGDLPGSRQWPAEAQRPPVASGSAGGPGGAAPTGCPGGPAGTFGNCRNIHQGGGPPFPGAPPSLPCLSLFLITVPLPHCATPASPQRLPLGPALIWSTRLSQVQALHTLMPRSRKGCKSCRTSSSRCSSPGSRNRRGCRPCTGSSSSSESVAAWTRPSRPGRQVPSPHSLLAHPLLPSALSPTCSLASWGSGPFPDVEPRGCALPRPRRLQMGVGGWLDSP